MGTRRTLPFVGLVLAAFLARHHIVPQAIDAPENHGGPPPHGGALATPVLGTAPESDPALPASLESSLAGSRGAGDAFAGEGGSTPSAADEEELLRLLDEARGENEPARRRERFAGICLRWAGFDPPGAIRLAQDLGLDPGSGALLPNLAQQWAAADPVAAEAWARRLPAGELRDDVYSRIVYETARRSPALAAGLLAEMRPGGEARAEAALTVLHFQTERDAAAGARVAILPAGSPRGLRVESIVDEQASAPPPAAW
jgi:hypothetical protein